MADPSGVVLLADVGGTNVRFALAAPEASMPLVADSVRRYRGGEFDHFAGAVERYLAETGARPRSIVIAAAGPRIEGEVRLTNLPWTISKAGTAERFGFDGVALINDFVAMGLAVTLLAEHEGERVGALPPARIETGADRTFAIVGPGTGLGVGALLIRDGRPHTLETEGGHIGFAPADDIESAVLDRLRARFGRVSNERILCGSGLVNLHDALRDLDGLPPSNLTPEEITERGATDAACRRTLERFAAILGGVAGDLVLGFGAWDGVYLTGGLAPLLAPWLGQGEFRRRFEDKGRLSVALARVPVTIVCHAEPGLLGAAAYAVIAAGRAERLVAAR